MVGWICVHIATRPKTFSYNLGMILQPFSSPALSSSASARHHEGALFEVIHQQIVIQVVRSVHFPWMKWA